MAITYQAINATLTVLRREHLDLSARKAELDRRLSDVEILISTYAAEVERPATAPESEKVS